MLASTERQVYIVRDGPLQSLVSVRCQSLDGSAVALTNYLPVYSTRLVFDAGVRWNSVNLTTLNAGKPVPDLSFQLVLFAAQGMCMTLKYCMAIKYFCCQTPIKLNILLF